MTAIAPHTDFVIRRDLDPAEADAVAELHRRVYGPEYGMNDEFVSRVAEGLHAAVARGWPNSGGGVWLIDENAELCGSLALTDEGEGLGRVRWFVLDSALRGQGLGRKMVSELVATAREQRFERLELETFSALTAAARIYREHGFERTWERERTDWGPPITYQQYELSLR